MFLPRLILERSLHEDMECLAMTMCSLTGRSAKLSKMDLKAEWQTCPNLPTLTPRAVGNALHGNMDDNLEERLVVKTQYRCLLPPRFLRVPCELPISTQK